MPVFSLVIWQLRSVFAKFDVNGSDDLDVFELSAAVAEMTGRIPTTVQVLGENNETFTVVASVAFSMHN